MKEWKHLEENVPDSIFIRVYEDRIDLMRAAIVDAKGTLYADFMFFFDVAIPWDYLSSPPQVNYHSAGFRMSPNLYANGKVCLCLLGNFVWTQFERWHSKRSNILQVLLSVQALVLNQRPFFNEPRHYFFSGQRLGRGIIGLQRDRVSLMLQNHTGLAADLPLQLGRTPGKETGQHAAAAVAVKPATKPIQKPGTTKVVTGKVKEKPTQKPGTPTQMQMTSGQVVVVGQQFTEAYPVTMVITKKMQKQRSLKNLLLHKDTYGVTVNPGVDGAFIAALIV
ncbi:putative ubiquitin-conjugating enzyme E2 38, partial [Drosera capensis]